jgi:hypothetical protein
MIEPRRLELGDFERLRTVAAHGTNGTGRSRQVSRDELESAIRTALGAQKRALFAMVFKQRARLTGLGFDARAAQCRWVPARRAVTIAPTQALRQEY